MSIPEVLIIGCGVGGAVTAGLLKQRGYHPIVFEKHAQVADAGASLMLTPNGLSVLEQLGVAADMVNGSEPVRYLVEKTAAGELLGESDIPATFEATYGHPAAAIKRTSLTLKLRQMLRDMDIDLREGWKLVDIRETDRDVTAVFENGESVTGCFLVGCDGIRSTVRRHLLARKGVSESEPAYTRLTQTSGFSKTPRSLLDKPGIRNWYGSGRHFICLPISTTMSSWAATCVQEEKHKESWRLYSPEEIKAHTAMLAADMEGWDPAIHEMVGSAERLVKYGLFDRDELEAVDWYAGRCVLIGDAAHATSPHLGQGANQTLEDCYTLCQSLPYLDTASSEFEERLSTLGPGPSLAELYFRPMAEKRQPRTAQLVRGARAVGKMRVATGPQACRERDAAIAASFRDTQTMAARYRDLFTATFPALK